IQKWIACAVSFKLLHEPLPYPTPMSQKSKINKCSCRAMYIWQKRDPFTARAYAMTLTVTVARSELPICENAWSNAFDKLPAAAISGYKSKSISVPNSMSSHVISMFTQDVKKCGGGGRKVGAAPVGGPERTSVGETAYRNRHQHASFKLFTHTHARHECQADSLLNKALNRLDRRELERDVKRRVLSCESLDHFHTRA